VVDGDVLVERDVFAKEFNSTSDRAVKANFANVDSCAILQQLASIPIQTWNFKSDAESVRHRGPMAQDFRAAFNLGTDDKHVATVDADGVGACRHPGPVSVSAGEREAARTAARSDRNAQTTPGGPCCLENAPLRGTPRRPGVPMRGKLLKLWTVENASTASLENTERLGHSISGFRRL
jgi:hypothetical protein